MEINQRYLALKQHFFFYFGCLAPILPFLMVLLRQLGIPIIVQGAASSVILILVIVGKPLIAAVADSFPKLRKPIFILVVSLMVSCLCSFYFFPPFHQPQSVKISGQLVVRREFYNTSTDLGDDFLILQHSDGTGDCKPTEVWDCQLLFCSQFSDCGNQTKFLIPRILKTDDAYVIDAFYMKTNSSVLHRYLESTITFGCKGGLYTGNGCQSFWMNYLFWLYILLIIVAHVSFSTATSISDAVCLDLVGSERDYGSQRAWGTVGWGLAGPIGGLLVDWYSGESFMKDYTPAFMMLFILGLIDIVLIMVALKVPQFSERRNVFTSLRPSLMKPRFIAFCIFVILIGSFDGVIVSYIFLLQEDMAREEQGRYMGNIKLIQGLSLGIQSLAEAPFMWLSGMFLNQIKPSTLRGMVFFIYIISLFSLGLVGTYGTVWMTLLISALHGPCYALGYSVNVVEAALMTPPGTSATIQSITNICYEALGYSLAILLGGILYESYGASGIFLVFGGIAILTCLLYLLVNSLFTPLSGEVEKKDVQNSGTLLTPDEAEQIADEAEQIEA